jgi:ferric-dicitrate binding protein FerR (iron transport regulator)
MTSRNDTPKQKLNKAIDALRHTSVDAAQTQAARERVLERLQAECDKVVPYPLGADAAAGDRIRSCEDFRALIPGLLASTLTPSRQLLLTDHIRECVGCRRALDAARRPQAAGTAKAAPSRMRPAWRYAIGIAAAAMLVFAALQVGVIRDLVWPVDVHAVAQVIDGNLYLVNGQVIAPVRVGQRIERQEAVRTGNESGAVLGLPDGSLIEMAARSELALVRGRDGIKIQLERGNVIVTAAKQRTGHLYVGTSDCLVSVVGTVFAVSASVKGSRVTVVEGEVVVEHAGTTESILPGQQTYTDPGMGAVPIEQEVAWSRDAEALLREIATFGQDFAKRVEEMGMRYTSNLVPLLPENTLVVASLPNIGQPFSESYDMFRRRIAENASLSAWWQARDGSSGHTVDEIARLISGVGSVVGSEVLLAFSDDGDTHAPLFITTTDREMQLLSLLEQELPKLDSSIWIVRNPAELNARLEYDPVVYVGDGLMVLSSTRQVRQALNIRSGGAQNRFAGTPLYTRLEQAYREGVGWLLAADLAQMVQLDVNELETHQALGFGNVQQLVLEQKTGLGSAASRAMLGFSQARQGIPAWLADPAPMGALEFVSPEAYAVSAAIVKDPALILDDIFGFIQGDSDALEDIQQFQQEQRLDLRRDIAEPLGNEFLIAMDGPVLPSPSWKIVAEINDAPRLENTMQWLVTNLNRMAAIEGEKLISLTSETVQGLTYYSLTREGDALQVHYAFWRGYVIIAPSRALVTDAIRIRDGGNTLGRSAALRAQMPPENRDYFSGLMYQNVSSMISSVGTDALRSVFGHGIDDALVGGLPRVVCVFGETDRILVSAKGSFGVNLAGMFTLHGMMGMAGIHGLPQ